MDAVQPQVAVYLRVNVKSCKKSPHKVLGPFQTQGWSTESKISTHPIKEEASLSTEVPFPQQQFSSVTQLWCKIKDNQGTCGTEHQTIYLGLWFLVNPFSLDRMFSTNSSLCRVIIWGLGRANKTLSWKAGWVWDDNKVGMCLREQGHLSDCNLINLD